MAAGGQCAQMAMQIDQCLRNELLFSHIHSKVSKSHLFLFLARFPLGEMADKAS
jgi:hypothetical protein